MDKEIGFIVKEEILKNIIKTHDVILVLGQDGVGKTATALKSTAGLGSVYYCSASSAIQKDVLAQYSETAKILNSIREAKNIQAENPVLIIDDLNKLDANDNTVIDGILSDRSRFQKIIVIARFATDANPFLPKIDVAVRIKQDTAEILMTKLCDIEDFQSPRNS